MNIIALTPDRDSYFKPLAKYLTYPLIFLRTPDWQQIKAHNPVTLLFLADWTHHIQQVIEQAQEEGIPTILIMDGFLEWKHQYLNPKWSQGNSVSIYQPVVADKVFCPGISTARILSAWGNEGKCEVTGMARLDPYANKRIELIPKTSNKKKKILILSANTPGYDKNQKDDCIKLFTDLHTFFEKNKSFQPIWRIRKNIGEVLPFTFINSNEASLAELIQDADAVITQPSTVTYESMIMGKPTAIADYSNCPNFFDAAWRITHSMQIESTVNSLLNTDPVLCFHQEYLLHDALSHIGDSAKISAEIIMEMVQHAQQAKKQGQKVNYPAKIHTQGHQNLAPAFSPPQLYPFNPYLRYSHEDELSRKLILAQKRIRDLEEILADKNLSYWFGKLRKKAKKLVN